MSKQVIKRTKPGPIIVNIERSKSVPGVSFAYLTRDGERLGQAVWGTVQDLDGLRAKVLNLNSVSPWDV